MGERDEPDQLTAPLRDRMARTEERLQLPMALLGLLWLALLIAEIAWKTPPWVEGLSYAIWGVFLVELVVRFALAPRKAEFLRDNWLTVLSVLLPVMRVFSALRVLRALGAVRGLQLARVVAAMSRVQDGLGELLRKHGLGYVLGLTLVVTFGGAAGMLAFEGGRGATGFATFGDALWWTAMLITTIGSQYWPATAEGRVLALLLSAYALGVLGYITAALSSFLIGRDANERAGSIAGERSIDALRAEVERLTVLIEQLPRTGSGSSSSPGSGPDSGSP